MEETKREKAEKSVNTYAALSVGFVCIVIGLPLWWKTTTVYRVSLPYTEIEHLNSLQTIAQVKVKVVVFDENIARRLPLFVDKLEQQIEGREFLDKKLVIEYLTSVRKATDAEKITLDSKTTVKALDALWGNSLGSTDDAYVVALLPKATKLTKLDGVAGIHRTAYVKSSDDDATTAARVSSLVREVFSNEKAVLNALKHAKGATHDQTDKASMRSVRTHPGYELTFTLINPQPEILNAQWDMRAAEKAYLEPLKKKLESYAKIEINSQVLYKISLGTRPKRDSAKNMSTLAEGDLPHIINPVEAYLGSHVSNDPNLNFIVYLPSRDQSPLQILHSNGEPSKTNTFLSPRWGSFMVYNTIVPENASLPYQHSVDMEKVMSILIPQIKLLLGIQSQNAPHIEYLSSGKEMITEWEVMSWLRSGCVENTMSSVVTLTSLADLLQKINNIVINDAIGHEVEKAVKFIKRSNQELANGDLHNAYLSSLQAIQSSEKAFFDPSLLELLYFPEDQKFAIYVPLFLPVGIPIFMSVMQAIRYLTKKPDDKAKSKTEESKKSKKND